MEIPIKIDDLGVPPFIQLFLSFLLSLTAQLTFANLHRFGWWHPTQKELDTASSMISWLTTKPMHTIHHLLYPVLPSSAMSPVRLNPPFWQQTVSDPGVTFAAANRDFIGGKSWSSIRFIYRSFSQQKRPLSICTLIYPGAKNQSHPFLKQIQSFSTLAGQIQILCCTNFI